MTVRPQRLAKHQLRVKHVLANVNVIVLPDDGVWRHLAWVQQATTVDVEI